MFTFLATILSIKWLTEHVWEIVIFIVIVISAIVYYRNKRRAAIQQSIAVQKAAQEKAQLEKQKQLEKQMEETRAAIADAEDLITKAQNKVSPPEEIDGKNIMYQYKDVIIIPDGKPESASAGDYLELKDDGESIYVKAHGIMIGRMKDNRLADMVRDWKKAGDPIRAYSVDLTDEGPMIALYFYGDSVGKFLARNPDAKLIELKGKQDDLAFYSVGVRCEVEYDQEDEKHLVTCDGALIGTLPGSAIEYAEDHDQSPEDLDVIIADIEYDVEKDRDIISVYIA